MTAQLDGYGPDDLADDEDAQARVYQLRPAVEDQAVGGAELAEVDDDSGGDAERELVEPGHWGGSADAPPEPRTLYATVIDRGREPRPPIVPAWARSGRERREFARVLAAEVWYHGWLHALRSPLYACKIAFYAPQGAGRLVLRQLRWWWLIEQHGLRQEAANRNDPETWLKLHRTALSVRRWRGIVLAAELVGLVTGAALLRFEAPLWAQLLAVAVVAPVLARLGRPAGQPITVRTYTGPRFTRLHAEQVRAAIVSMGAVKDPAEITFPHPGVHRDGPGWLARFNLPAGVEAVKVLEARGKLSSALRLPVDQVWPEAGPDHSGQVDLWVGQLPASKMGQPRWSLLGQGARTSVFASYEFGTDPRQRPVKTPLFARNFLIGGVPGSGKSYGARALAMVALLDPTCELKIAEFKGVGDFGDMAELCSTYVCGIDDQALDAGGDLIAWGLAEAERRAARVLRFKKAGLAPEGKVTPELAARPGSGLHPVVIIIDEAHELFAHSKTIAVDAERLIKRGRALGLIIVLATQVPDSKSVPPNITRCVTVRWCMAVLGQVENDMILGTGAYKRGLTATSYRPGNEQSSGDAGWGVMIGLARPGPVRSHFPSQADTAALIARATALRGGQVVTSEAGPVGRDFLADLGTVYAGEAFVSWQQLAAGLAEQLPEHYASITSDAVSARAASLGVQSTDGRDRRQGGRVLKGAKRSAVAAAIEARQISSGGQS